MIDCPLEADLICETPSDECTSLLLLLQFNKFSALTTNRLICISPMWLDDCNSRDRLSAYQHHWLYLQTSFYWIIVPTFIYLLGNLNIMDHPVQYANETFTYLKSSHSHISNHHVIPTKIHLLQSISDFDFWFDKKPTQTQSFYYSTKHNYFASLFNNNENSFLYSFIPVNLLWRYIPVYMFVNISSDERDPRLLSSYRWTLESSKPMKGDTKSKPIDPTTLKTICSDYNRLWSIL